MTDKIIPLPLPKRKPRLSDGIDGLWPAWVATHPAVAAAFDDAVRLGAGAYRVSVENGEMKAEPAIWPYPESEDRE